MAIKVTPKKRQIKLPKGLDVLFQVSIGFLAVTLLTFLLFIFLEGRAINTLYDIEEITEEKLAEIPELGVLERKAHYYRRLMEDFQEVLAMHHLSSSVFPFIQSIIHPRARISNINVNFEERRVDFSGEAESLIVAGQQFYYLKSLERVRNVELSGLSMIQEREDHDGPPIRRGVSFSFDLRLIPGIFAFDGVLPEVVIAEQPVVEEPVVEEEPEQPVVEEPVIEEEPDSF